MARYLEIMLYATEPVRLDEDCPECGWADLWRASLVLLCQTGVSTAGAVTRCQRCNYSPPPVREGA